MQGPQKLEYVGDSHVVVPIAFFDKVMEVYYAAKAQRLVPKQDAVLQERPATEEELGEFENIEVHMGVVPSDWEPLKFDDEDDD